MRNAYFMQSLPQIQLVSLLLIRLERVSVDSYWAHRASGVRGGLLKALEKFETGQSVDEFRAEALDRERIPNLGTSRARKNQISRMMKCKKLGIPNIYISKEKSWRGKRTLRFA